MIWLNIRSSGKGKQPLPTCCWDFWNLFPRKYPDQWKHAGKQAPGILEQDRIHKATIHSLFTIHWFRILPSTKLNTTAQKVLMWLKKTGMQKLVDTKPAGIHTTTVKENGKISVVANGSALFLPALYKDADLFVLDEPFNELDDISEIKCWTSCVNWLLKEKIIILITHTTGTRFHSVIKNNIGWTVMEHWLSPCPAFPKMKPIAVVLPFPQLFVKPGCTKSGIEYHRTSLQYPQSLHPYHWHNVTVYPFNGRNKGKLNRLLVWNAVWVKTETDQKRA